MVPGEEIDSRKRAHMKIARSHVACFYNLPLHTHSRPGFRTPQYAYVQRLDISNVISARFYIGMKTTIESSDIFSTQSRLLQITLLKAAERRRKFEFRLVR